MLLTSFLISPVRIRHTLHSIIFWDDTERTVVITEQGDEVPFRLTQIYPVTFLLSSYIPVVSSLVIIFKWVVALLWWPLHLKIHLPVNQGRTLHECSSSPAVLWLLCQLPKPLTKVKCLFPYQATKYNVPVFPRKKVPTEVKWEIS